MELPSISFVITTFNSEKTLEMCLASIREQAYPQGEIEIILADGGSKDGTLTIVKKYRVDTILVSKERRGPEYDRALGAHAAKNEILAFVDHDNELPYKTWLLDMVRPFVEDPRIVGVETLRYHYSRTDSMLGRYFSLFGVNDVLPFYFGKADRLSYLYTNLRDYGVFRKATIIEKEKYLVVDFTEDAIPTLGSNGFLVRRELLLRNAQSSPEMFFHIDVNVDLIRKGFTRYAFVKNTIIHRSNERGILQYFKRRRLFMIKYRFESISKRRYSVYEQKKDRKNLLVFIIFSATLVKPLFDSMRGFFKVPDIAWFLHPIICFGTLVVYTAAFIEITYKDFFE